MVAGLVEAERLIILSDVEGLYTEDPRHNSRAELIEYVEEITPELEEKAGGAGSIVGTGGMYSKILAAKRAVSHGITVHIISGRKDGLLKSLMEGNHCGTLFKPKRKSCLQEKGGLPTEAVQRGALS